jgi:hypothetical protein
LQYPPCLKALHQDNVGRTILHIDVQAAGLQINVSAFNEHLRGHLILDVTGIELLRVAAQFEIESKN